MITTVIVKDLEKLNSAIKKILADYRVNGSSSLNVEELCTDYLTRGECHVVELILIKK